MGTDSCNQVNCIIFEEWYINKLNKQRVEKVLNKDGRPKLKLKKLKEILAYENKSLCQAKQHDVVQSSSSLQKDDDMEIESMTLKQMQCLFKKSSSKTSRNNKVSALSPLQGTRVKPGTSDQDTQSDSSFHGNILALPSQLGDYDSQSLPILDNQVGETAVKMTIHETREMNENFMKIEGTKTELWRKADLSVDFTNVKNLQVDETEDKWTPEMFHPYNKQPFSISRSPRFMQLDKVERKKELKHTLFTEAGIDRPGFAYNITSSVCKYDDFREFNSDGNDCGSPESGQVDGLYSTVHWKNPKVRLVLEDDSDPGDSIFSSPKEAAIVEDSVHTCTRSRNLGSCLSTLKLTDLTTRKPYFEISDNQIETGSELQRDCVSEQDSCTSSQIQIGKDFCSLDKGRQMDISIHEEMGDKIFDNSGGQSGSPVKDCDVAKELICRSQSSIDQRASWYAEQNIEFTGTQKAKFPSSGKDKETCKAVNELPNSSHHKSGTSVALLAVESLDMEDDSEHQKPTKIPCKRKAMSPLSQQKLLDAVNSKDACCLPHQDSEVLAVLNGLKEHLSFNRSNNVSHPRCQEWVEVPRRKIIQGVSNSTDQPKDAAQKSAATVGSPVHNIEPALSHNSTSQSLHFKVPCSSFSCLHAVSPVDSEFLESGGRKDSNSLDKPLSPTLHGKSSLLESRASSPLVTKGILRSSSQTCKGACTCEQCRSLRFRAEQASQFSQRQMQDIEGLATKLIKELDTMRTIVEENILSESKTSIRNSRVLEQVKMATVNAVETEEMAKKWLLIMARDCNRYCKIMRMQQRKLTFADETGGQLCQVKLFQSQSCSELPLLGINEIKVCEADIQNCPSAEDSAYQQALSSRTNAT